MTENATIFIPDISGFTEFLSTTELVHSAHIINELMELLIEANVSDCTLAEVEGDALLFYRKGEPLHRKDVIRQCLHMFRSFHSRLKMIERDSICQCGACQSATNLTLKFIVHYGPIKEIKISRFTKASGLDMIIAHRLLKNNIPSNEYILTTHRYLHALSSQECDSELTWETSSETYPVIGQLDFQYTLLDQIKRSVAEPPLPEPFAFSLGNNMVGIEIQLPIMRVYELLIDLENRVHWIPGLKQGSSEQPIDRLGTRHICVFDEETYEVVPRQHEIGEGVIRYVEMNKGLSTGLAYPVEYKLTAQTDNCTRVEFMIGEVPDYPLVEKILKLVMHEWHHIAEAFKPFCESHQSIRHF